jgi:hypothetical protein
MVLKGDQDKSSFALGFSRSMAKNIPIALIAGMSITFSEYHPQS